MRRSLLLLLLAAVFGLGHAHAQQSGPQWWDLSRLGTEGPSGRLNPAVAPFPPTGEVVLFGGYTWEPPSMKVYLNDTWVWSDKGWVKKEVAASPPQFEWARMVYDDKYQRIVLLGVPASSSYWGPRMWFWDGQSWVGEYGSGVPVGVGFSLAFDEVAGEVILFGGWGAAGYTCLDDTYVLTNGNQWTWVGGSHPPGQPIAPPGVVASATAAYPPARENGAMAFDRSSGRVVLHGGYDQCTDTHHQDTWVWGGRTAGWTQAPTSSSPPPSELGYQMAYYGLGGYLVLAGSDYYHDPDFEPRTPLWKWTGSTWEKIPQPPPDSNYPPGHPIATFGFGWTEVPGYEGLLLFGGGSGYGGHISSPELSLSWAWGQLPEVLNKAPIADAGEDQRALVGDSVTLDGSASSDPDGDPIGFNWVLSAQPAGSTVSLTGWMTPTPSLIPDMPGTYWITVTVDDGHLTSEPDAVIVTTLDASDIIDAIQVAIGALPATDFKSGGSNSLSRVLDDVEALLVHGNVAASIKKTLDFRIHIDGCADERGIADKNDWIIGCGSQIEIRRFVDGLIRTLRGMN